MTKYICSFIVCTFCQYLSINPAVAQDKKIAFETRLYFKPGISINSVGQQIDGTIEGVKIKLPPTANFHVGVNQRFYIGKRGFSFGLIGEYGNAKFTNKVPPLYTSNEEHRPAVATFEMSYFNWGYNVNQSFSFKKIKLTVGVGVLGKTLFNIKHNFSEPPTYSTPQARSNGHWYTISFDESERGRQDTYYTKYNDMIKDTKIWSTMILLANVYVETKQPLLSKYNLYGFAGVDMQRSVDFYGLLNQTVKYTGPPIRNGVPQAIYGQYNIMPLQIGLQIGLAYRW